MRAKSTDRETMNHQITAIVADDETILLDGETLVGVTQVANALQSALENDPHSILVIGPMPREQYKGIGTIIYASQRAGMPVENLRLTMDNGDVVTYSELSKRNAEDSLGPLESITYLDH
jgi:hypothetical protein